MATHFPKHFEVNLRNLLGNHSNQPIQNIPAHRTRPVTTELLEEFKEFLSRRRRDIETVASISNLAGDAAVQDLINQPTDLRAETLIANVPRFSQSSNGVAPNASLTVPLTTLRQIEIQLIEITETYDRVCPRPPTPGL